MTKTSKEKLEETIDKIMIKTGKEFDKRTVESLSASFPSKRPKTL